MKPRSIHQERVLETPLYHTYIGENVPALIDYSLEADGYITVENVDFWNAKKGRWEASNEYNKNEAYECCAAAENQMKEDV